MRLPFAAHHREAVHLACLAMMVGALWAYAWGQSLPPVLPATEVMEHRPTWPASNSQIPPRAIADVEGGDRDCR